MKLSGKSFQKKEFLKRLIMNPYVILILVFVVADLIHKKVIPLNINTNIFVGICICGVFFYRVLFKFYKKFSLYFKQIRFIINKEEKKLVDFIFYKIPQLYFVACSSNGWSFCTNSFASPHIEEDETIFLADSKKHLARLYNSLTLNGQINGYSISSIEGKEIKSFFEYSHLLGFNSFQLKTLIGTVKINIQDYIDAEINCVTESGMMFRHNHLLHCQALNRAEKAKEIGNKRERDKAEEKSEYYFDKYLEALKTALFYTIVECNNHENKVLISKNAMLKTMDSLASETINRIKQNGISVVDIQEVQQLPLIFSSKELAEKQRREIKEAYEEVIDEVKIRITSKESQDFNIINNIAKTIENLSVCIITGEEAIIGGCDTVLLDGEKGKNASVRIDCTWSKWHNKKICEEQILFTYKELSPQKKIVVVFHREKGIFYRMTIINKRVRYARIIDNYEIKQMLKETKNDCLEISDLLCEIYPKKLFEFSTFVPNEIRYHDGAYYIVNSVMMKNPGELVLKSDSVINGAYNAPHDAIPIVTEQKISFDELSHLVSNSKDKSAFAYSDMNDKNWKSFIRDNKMFL